MRPYITTEVFTPTSPARLTFVERETINAQLVSALKIPGKQVVDRIRLLVNSKSDVSTVIRGS